MADPLDLDEGVRAQRSGCCRTSSDSASSAAQKGWPYQAAKPRRMKPRASGWAGTGGSRARSAAPTRGCVNINRVSLGPGSIDIHRGDMKHDLQPVEAAGTVPAGCTGKVGSTGAAGGPEP